MVSIIYEPTHLIPFPSPKKAHNWPIVHICFIKKLESFGTAHTAASLSAAEADEDSGTYRDCASSHYFQG